MGDDESERMKALAKELRRLRRRADAVQVEEMWDASPADPPAAHAGEYVLYGPEGQVEHVMALPDPAPLYVEAAVMPRLAWTRPDPAEFLPIETVTYRRVGEWSYQRSV